jgi:Fur family ferric uptake transcriptional regulator
VAHALDATRLADDAFDVLRARGVRLTTPRRIIVQVLADAAPEHLSPAEIAERVQVDHPEVNASTVYRCLDLLRELHVVSHSHVPGGATIYHLHEQVHQHLVCEVCGRIVDVPLELFEPAAAAVRAANGFELHLGHEALSGRCADCRET